MNDTEYDPHDRAEWLAEAHAEIAEQRIINWMRRRPPAFEAEGDLKPEVAQWIDRYLAGDRGSLVMIGEVGTGKTWHLWQMQAELIYRQWVGVFEIASAYDVKKATDLPTDTERIDRWKSAHVFALDDLAAQGVSDWTIDAIGELIDYRWQYRRPTIITSNQADLAAFLGPRAASRLSDGASLVKFIGRDFRKAGNK